MKNNLMVIKMSDGSNVLSELEYIDSSYNYKFINPIIYTMKTIQGIEIATAEPFLPGSINNEFEIPCNSIITMSTANTFFNKFYGSALMRFFIQEELQNSILKGNNELDMDAQNRLELKKQEILLKFGLIDEIDEFEQQDISKRVIH